MVTASEAVRDAREKIVAAGISDTAALDAELIVGVVCELDRVDLRVRGRETILTADQTERIANLVGRRAKAEPIAYLLGSAWFYGREFHVDSRVLIPRPETELLVDIAVEHLKQHSDATSELRVADVCTGSGCVGISIAAECQAPVYASDISTDALKVARINAKRYAPELVLQAGDLLEPLNPFAPFEVIVSNPPYVVDGDENAPISPGVREYEPHVALFVPQGGVASLVEQIAMQAKELLNIGGLLALEHGIGQESEIGAVLAKHGFVDIQSVSDLAGINRVVVARLRGA